LASAAADPDNQIYGTNLMPGNYYDHCSFARTYGGDILDATHENFVFNVDQASIDAAKWVTSLRTELNAAPDRAEAEGLEFSAGNMATAQSGVYAVNSLAETIGDRFKFDFRLFPNSPDHERGYQGFVETFSIAAQSEHPELAYSLTVAETSTEAALNATINGVKMPGPRLSIWTNPEVQEVSDPIMDDAAQWMASQDGPFPHPSNLRFQELQDTWANTSLELFYGEVGFEEGMEAVQTACQEIMEIPRA
jgi:ABC-type glycerol-3-phosphate transport system substrate-binding protein